MRRSRMRPNPLGSTTSTAMATNTLVVLLLRPTGVMGFFAVRDGQVGFIHLDKPLELVPAWSNHGASKPVQHGPGCLVTAQAQNALQPQSAHALLLIGQIPGSCQPHPQWRSGLVKDGPGGHCSLVLASPTHQAGAAGSVHIPRIATARTDEAMGPAQLLQKGQAGFFGGKPVKKFVPGAGVVLSGSGR